jgi:hypothetical protein
LGGTTKRFNAYLEVGAKRTFAGAIEWPGWCRSGRDEADALQKLAEYGPRYEDVLRETHLGFVAPSGVSDFTVVERLAGSSGTDFGAPGAAPSDDSRAVSDADLERFEAMLYACWRAFDDAVSKGEGRTLRLGPRGGGRSLDEIVSHVLGAEEAYLRQLAWKLDSGRTDDIREALTGTRDAVLSAMRSAVRTGVPERGPRGGKLWTPRYFVRRVAWHVLDHAWEIGDRIA